jgi:hypothetical protein
MGRPTNQSRAERAGFGVSAACRTATGRQCDVVIIDLTAEGSRVFTKSVLLSVGLRLRIRPE